MKRYALIIASAFVAAPLHATMIVQGNNTEAPRGFTSPVATKVLHKQTGTFFIGLGPNGSATGAWSLSKAVRPLPSLTRARFEPIGNKNTAISLNDLTISHLALASPANKPATLAFVTSDQSKKITTATTDGRTVKQTAEDLNLDTGATANSINNVAADDNTGNQSYIYAALADSSNTRSLALIAIEKKTNGTLNALQTKNAKTGLDGNEGVQLDGDITQVKGDSGGNAADLLSGNEANKVALHWDSKLQRLYIGLRIQTATSGTSDRIGKTVIVAYQDCGKIILQKITSDNSISLNLTTKNEIIVNKNTIGGEISRATHLGVMHASTGTSYLIVCGGTQNDPNSIGVSNAVHALPLVDKPGDDNHGTLAKTDSPLQDFKFVTPATSAGDLSNTTDRFSRVGGGSIPKPTDIDTRTLPISNTDEVADMVVDGDTVYIAIEGQTSSTKETGVFYSHAMFDVDGKIAGWTTWSKVAVPYNPFPSVADPAQCCCTCGVKFIEPDLKTGSLWIVEGITAKLVGYSDWNRGTESNNLPALLNQLMPCGVYSSLDLHQATRGFFRRAISLTGPGSPPTAANATTHRYALFGGYERVIFTRTSEALGDPSNHLATTADQVITLKSPQLPTTNFTLPENLLETFLPEHAGCVNILEYARRTDIDNPEDECSPDKKIQPEGASNYFFAGTPNGLYVFANGDKKGFLSAYSGGSEVVLGKLNEAPFTGARWFKAPNIPGDVIDITTSGRALYILTNESSGKPAYRTSTILKVDFAGDIDNMFAAPQTIAKTGQGVFETIQEFYGIQIISSGDAGCPDEEEQLALATNRGMYTSHADQTGGNRGLPDANNEDQAQWWIFDSTEEKLFHAVAGTDMPVRYTVWPLSMADRFNCKAFDHSNVHQESSVYSCFDSCFESCLELSGPTLLGNFHPDHFNAFEAHAGSCFTPLPFTRYFWQDGARRMFVFGRTQQHGAHDRIGVVPFFPTDWSVQQPTILTNPIFDEVKRIYWLRQFGVTGFLLAGTDRGIIALE